MRAKQITKIVVSLAILTAMFVVLYKLSYINILNIRNINVDSLEYQAQAVPIKSFIFAACTYISTAAVFFSIGWVFCLWLIDFIFDKLGRKSS